MLGNKSAAAIAALVAVVLVAAGAAVLLLRDGDGLEPGFVTTGSAGTAMTHDATVQLPIGTVRLSSAAPQEEIAGRRIGRDEAGEVRAADGAAIVPLAWTFRPSLSYDDLLDHPTTFSLALTAGGKRTALGEQDVDPHDARDTGLLAEGSFIAVVAGSGHDLAVQVTYEGETQSVDMASGEVAAGRAEALYPDGPVTLTSDDDCDARRTRETRYVDAGAGSIYCRVDPVTRTPYLPGLGWSENGRLWSVVDVTVTAPATVTWIPTGVRYRVRRGPVEVSLSDSEQVRAPRTATDDRVARGGTWVFDSPADASLTLEVTAPLTAAREAGAAGGPATISFGVDQTFSLER